MEGKKGKQGQLSSRFTGQSKALVFIVSVMGSYWLFQEKLMISDLHF